MTDRDMADSEARGVDRAALLARAAQAKHDWSLTLELLAASPCDSGCADDCGRVDGAPHRAVDKTTRRTTP